MGRKMTNSETCYPSWKGEMAAIIFGIPKYPFLPQLSNKYRFLSPTTYEIPHHIH